MSEALAQYQGTGLISQADSTDDRVIAMWLHGKADSTQAAYRFEVEKFDAFMGKGLRLLTLGDLQDKKSGVVLLRQ